MVPDKLPICFLPGVKDWVIFPGSCAVSMSPLPEWPMLKTTVQAVSGKAMHSGAISGQKERSCQ